MKIKDIVSQLANRINQPHVIEVYFRQVYAKGFVNGTKKSPWISVEERLPDEGQEVFALIMREGISHIREEKFYRKTYLDQSAKWVHGNSRVLVWMPIPSFDEILEANKDVLKPIKDKNE